MCCKELKDILGGRDECYSVSTVASEKGREFRLNLAGGKTACKVRVDACLITDAAVQKCDYILKVCPDSKVFLIELKGTDVEHAVGQILSTFAFVKGKMRENKASPLAITGHIISSAIPRNAEQRFRNLRERALKNNKLNIVKHSFRCELSI